MANKLKYKPKQQLFTYYWVGGGSYAADYANTVMKHMHKSTMSDIAEHINYKWRTQLLG